MIGRGPGQATSRPARDRLGGLCCQVPGCRAVIHALTGFQELEKLGRHFARAHLVRKTMAELMDTRAEWENRVDGSRRAPHPHQGGPS